MEQFTPPILNYIAVGVLCFLLGLVLGYVIWARRTSSDGALTKLTWTQIFAASITFVYLLTSPAPDTAIAIALIGIIPSESVGLLVAKGLETRAKK